MAEKKQKCTRCGKDIAVKNRVNVSNAWSITGISDLCVDCQQDKFDFVQESVGDAFVSIFMCCLFFDKPFDGEVAKDIAYRDDTENDKWILYLKELKKTGQYEINAGFCRGEFPMQFDECVMSSKEYDIRTENYRHVKWGMKFGEDGSTRPYTEDEITELDILYKEQAAEYKGAMTQRVDMAIREICICKLEWKKCIGAGDSSGAKKYADMVNAAMAREGLRANDSKPTEAMRIDSLIDRLEKKGCMTNGPIVGRKQLIDILAKDHPQYTTSLDVVDAMMMAIINTSRRNNGESELNELPKSAQIEDVFGELLEQPTEDELKAMSEMGVVRPQREGEPFFTLKEN